MPGMPGMSEEELMRDALASASAKVPPGKVRRKKPAASKKTARGFGALASGRR